MLQVDQPLDDQKLRRLQQKKQYIQRRRSVPEYRIKEQAFNKQAKKASRKILVVRGKEREKDTKARREKRKNPEVKDEERERETKARREKRQIPEVRDEERAKDAEARREKRQIPEVRDEERGKDAEVRREKRQIPEVKEHEKERETEARREKRQIPEVRDEERGKDAEARREKRQIPEVKEHEKERETPARREKRKPGVCVEAAIQLFQQDIQKGPSYICTSCNRLLNRGSVVQFDLEKFEENGHDVLVKCRTEKVSFDQKEYICTTCKTALLRGQIPQYATYNGLQLDDVPEPISDLTPLEATFISRRIPFMKLLALPRGKQKAVHGCVVNVPVEPAEIANVLPRLPSPDSMITVKLKRKLQYRGHSYMENVRPKVVMDSLYVLKNTLKNRLYSDVDIDESWNSNSERENSLLWKSLTSPSETSSAEEAHNEEGDSDEKEEWPNEDDEVEDERSKLSGLQFDTCLQPKDASTNLNAVLSVAPGEGKRPQPMEMDDNSEELSFPHLFPTGKFGFSYNRNVKLSMKKYFQCRILNCDGRFAKNIGYLFYAQYRCEAKEVKDSLSIALRKGKGDDITAGQIKEKTAAFISSELGIHFLQKIRGSPAFFNKLLYDLLGMIRQLGPCTWFITLSSADLKWKDTLRIIGQQQGRELSDADIDKLSWEERCDLLRCNPVTAASHFNDRVQQFLKHILLNKSINPLGEITDYKYRIEFQQRGSPHVHMLAWVKDAPSLEKDSYTCEEVREFVDECISCRLPPTDVELTNLLTTVQRHTHSAACRKHGSLCR